MKEYKFIQLRMDVKQETFNNNETGYFRTRFYEKYGINYREMEPGSFVNISINGECYDILLKDIDGQEEFTPLIQQHIRDAQGVILYYDICSISTNYELLVSRIEDIKSSMLSTHDVDNFPIVVIGIAASCNKYLIEQYNDKIETLSNAVKINSFFVTFDDVEESFLAPIFDLVNQANALCLASTATPTFQEKRKSNVTNNTLLSTLFNKNERQLSKKNNKMQIKKMDDENNALNSYKSNKKKESNPLLSSIKDYQKETIKIAIMGEDCEQGGKLGMEIYKGKQKAELVCSYRGETSTQINENAIGNAFLAKTQKVNNISVKFEIWGVVSQERLSSIIPMYLRDKDIILITFSVINRDSFDAISNTIMPLIKTHAPKHLYCLVATCIEARENTEVCASLKEHNLTFITKDEGAALAKTIGAIDYFECSTLDYKSVEAVFIAIASSTLNRKNKLKIENTEDVNDVFINEERLNDAIKYACKNEISTLVAILDRKGELYRQWGYSPYHIAVLANNSELCKKLYDTNYLQLNQKDKQGLTAYQLAIKEQKTDCKAVLQMLMAKAQQQELLRLAQSEKVRVQSFAQEQQALRHELERLLDKDEFGHLELLKPIYTALLTIRANYFANRNLYPSNFDIERLKSPAALLDDTCRKKYELNQQKSKLIKTDRLFRHLNEQILSLEKLIKQLKNSAKLTSIVTIIQQLQYGYKSYIEAVCNASQNKREDLYRLRVLLSSATSPSGFLKMAVANTLTTGRDSDQSSGLHAVHKIGYIHFKEKPHAPGVEFIVTSLGNLLAGQGATPTELFKIINEQGYPYVFQASKTVIGQELATLIKHSPKDINKIKESNYSAMVFLSLLTDPQDGKPDNFMIKYDTDGSIVIVGIDNDIAFADPIVLKHETGENKGKHFVNIRNVLYFLPQMQQPVDKGFLEIFLKQRPEIILTEWLMSIVNKNKDYESLLLQGIFNETDFQGDKISDKRGLQLPIRFSVGTISKMYRKLVRLQDKLQETNETNSEVSHQTLFELLEPEVAKHYKGVQAKNKDDIHECIKTLYEESITNWSELKKFREGLERGDTRLMTTQAIKTATEHGFEDNRTQVMIDTFKELLQEIIYDRADEVAPLLYKKLDELSMCIKQQPLLHIIAEIRHQNLLKWLVKHELLNDVNQLNKNGYSALHITASLGDIDMVKLLVEEGHADVTIKNKLNRTPLEVAKDRGHTAVAAYLSTFPPEELVQYNIKLV